MIVCMWNLETWHRGTYLQGRSRDTDIENGLVNTVEEGGGGTNCEIYTTMCKADIHTRPCVKLTYIYYHIKIASGKLLYGTGSSAWCSVMT